MNQRSAEERFLTDVLNCEYETTFYPYIAVRGESGSVRKITLREAIDTALNELPCTKGKGDEEPNPRYRIVLELRYGLAGDIPKTFQQIGLALNMGKGRAWQIFLTARRSIRRSSMDVFRLFLSLSPEELLELREKAMEAACLRQENDALRAAISVSEVKKTDFAGIPEDIYRLPLDILKPYLSVKNYNSLCRGFISWHSDAQRITMVGELIKLTENSILGGFRQFGQKSLSELREGLRALNLLQYSRLIDDAEEDESSEDHFDDLEEDDDEEEATVF